MRRLLATLAFGGVTACVLTAAALAVIGAKAPPQPRLMLVARTPLTLAGEYFRAREPVKLVVSVDEKLHLRRLRASTRGSFSARFDEVTAIDRCSSNVWARATGSRGSRAVLKFPQLQCPPALSPP